MDVWTLNSEVEEVTDRFRLLPFNSRLQKEGEQFSLTIDPDSAADIVARSGFGSERAIPVDMEHFTYLEAAAEGKEESEYLAELPGESPAAGFVKLTAEEDGIYANVIRWVARAEMLLKEKAYRYFSPVIRGLQEGKPRITSIALTNQPALYDIQPLTLVAENMTNGNTTAEPLNYTYTSGSTSNFYWTDETQTKGTNMEFLKKLADVLELEDAAALTEADKLESVIEGRVLSLVEAGKKTEALTAELDVALTELAVRKEADIKAERNQLIAKGKTAGKLTDKLAEWAATQDVAALSAFLDSAPVVVKIGETIKKKDVGNVGEQCPETPESRQLAASFEQTRAMNKKEA